MREVSHDDKWDEPEEATPFHDSGESHDSAEAPDENPLDAMHPDVAPGLSLIVQMRTYDVLMALYRHFDEEKAKKLYEVHAEGRVLGALPYIASDDA